MLTEQSRYLKDESIVRRQNEGTPVGANMLLKVRSEETGGAWALVEAVISPHTQGPPLHINSQEDELFYVLEGAIDLQLGERRIELSAGCLGYVPKGSVHTFCNPYREPARILGFLSPGGFEHFFVEEEELRRNTPPGQQPDMGMMMSISRKHGGVFVGPPMSLDRPVSAED